MKKAGLKSILLSLVLLASTDSIAVTTQLTQDVLYSKNIFGVKDFDPTDFYIPAETDALPVLVFLQGGKVDKKHYSHLGLRLAENGVLAAFPNHDSILGKNFTTQKVLNAVWDHLLDLNQKEASPFYNRIDKSKLFVMGHSFGGTAAHNIAAHRCGIPVCTGKANVPQGLAGALFYGFHREGNSIEAKVPVHWIQGSLDNLTEAQNTFDLVSGADKSFYVVEGANHFGITNVNNPEGAKEDPVVPEISQDQSLDEISASIVSFIVSQETR